MSQKELIIKIGYNKKPTKDDYNKAKLVIAMYEADVTFKEATKIITNEYIKEINE